MFGRRELFVANVLWGFLNVLVGAAGLYFVFRYAVAVLASDDYTRRLLLGEWITGIVGDTSLAVLTTVSLYMGFRVVLLILSVASWETYIGTEYRQLKKNENQK